MLSILATTGLQTFIDWIGIGLFGSYQWYIMMLLIILVVFLAYIKIPYILIMFFASLYIVGTRVWLTTGISNKLMALVIVVFGFIIGALFWKLVK